LVFKDIAPIKKTTQLIKFPVITQTDQGVFMVEMIGNGISSRAII
jgi:hypothetical protein